MNKLFHLPENIPSQTRNAFRLMVIFLIGTLPFVVFLTFQAFHSTLWQIQIMPIVGAVLIIFEIAALFLIRQGRHELGTWLVLVFFQLVLIYASASISGIGFVLMMVAVMLTTFIAGQILPPRQAAYLILAGVIGGVTALLVDLYIPIARTTLPGFENIILIVVGILVLIYGVFIVRQFRDYSLRTKLLIAFIGITLLPLAALGIYANDRLRTTLNQDTQQKLSQFADQTALYVDTFIGNQLKVVGVEAQNPLYAQLLSLDPMQQAGSIQEANAAAALTASAHQDTTFINSYILLNNNGMVVLDTANNRGQDDSQAAFFKDAIAKTEPTVTGPLFDQKTGKASLYFSAPIKNQAGTILGVLVANYNASVIESLAENLIPPGNPENILFRVVDKNNLIRIAHTDNLPLLYKSYKNIAPDQIVALQKQGLLPPGTAQNVLATENDTVAGLENIAQAPYFVTTSQTLGALTLNTAAPMKTVPWIAFVRQSNVTVTAPLAEETRTISIISLLLIGLVTLVAFGFSQILATPILRLTSVAQQITGGDIAVQAKVESQDEIGQLAGTFNEMTSRLRQTLEDVRRRSLAVQTSAEVSRRLSAAADPHRLAVDVVEQVQSAFHYYHAHIYFLDEETGDLIMAGGTGEAGAALLARGHRVPKGRGLVGRAAAANAPVLVPDVSKEEGWLPNPLLPDTKSETAIPISVGKQVLGVLDVQQNVVNGLGQEDVELLQSLASQVAISLQNSRTFEESRAKAELETMVNTIGQKIQRAGSVEDTLQIAVREIGVALGASRVKANIGTTRQGNGDGASSN